MARHHLSVGGSTAGEVHFWSRQLSEHALFLSLGLEQRDLRRAAAAARESWETFRRRVFTDGWLVVPLSVVVPEVLRLCAALRALKTEVYDRSTRGEWLGWLFPTFVEHTRRELDLFVEHLNEGLAGRPMRAPDELCRWLRFMAEHAAFAAHLLDPTEAVLIRQAVSRMGEFTELHASCASTTPQLVELSKRAGRELDLYFTQSGIGTPTVRSVIHPVLAEHVVREGRRFLYTLEGY